MSDIILLDNTPQRQCLVCGNFFPATSKFFYSNNPKRKNLFERCRGCIAASREQEKPVPPPPGHKFCIKCNVPKKIDEQNFRPKSNGRDGFYNVCRECMNKQDTERTHRRHQETPPTFDETILKECVSCHHPWPATPLYFDRNKRKADGLEPECKPCKKQRNKAYNFEHADEKQWRSFMYKEANRESIREKGRAYVRAHRAEHNARWRARYEQIKQNGGTYTTSDVLRQYEKQDGKCYWCEQKLDDYHVDHIDPVSRGGSNGPENIVIACPFCNQSKGNKTLEEWLIYLEKFIL